MSASIIYMAEPPVGYTRHTIDAPNIHRELIAVGVLITVLVLMAVMQRVFVRLFVKKNEVCLDDCKLSDHLLER